jgi:alpha-tubulin suppressor-like RCC1 family protein
VLGDNSSGQPGNGTTTQSSFPVTDSGIDGVTMQTTEIAAGYIHTCALLSGGAEQCWGDNTYGQLGNEVSAISATPQYISGVPKVAWSSSNAALANIDANG